MEIGKKRYQLQAIHIREEFCEELFDAWVSELGMGGVLDALGELLWWLDGIASCRWGCRGGDHEEQHLLGRSSANASAALLLLKRGYMDQALGVFRQLAETANLLNLFARSSEDYKEWRRDEGGRKNRYSASKVRLKLARLNIKPGMRKDAYQLLSKYGIHPGPSIEPRPHDSPKDSTVGLAYRPAACIILTVAVASEVAPMVIFGSHFVPQANAKQDALHAAEAADEKIRAIDLEVLQKKSAVVLQPPEIEVTVEAHAETG